MALYISAAFRPNALVVMNRCCQLQRPHSNGYLKEKKTELQNSREGIDTEPTLTRSGLLGIVTRRSRFDSQIYLGLSENRVYSQL